MRGSYLVILLLFLGILRQGRAQTDPDYPAASPAPEAIAYVEYYFDEDPGFGNGTPISVGPGTEISAVSVDLATVSLSKGVHQLVIRSKDINGIWSLPTIRDFIVDDPPAYPESAVMTDVAAAEYFFDDDPGFGNGTGIPVSAATDIGSIVIAPSTADLPEGVHRLYTRTRNASGAWSFTSVRDFLVFNDPGYPHAPVPPGQVLFAEYFIDEDPGPGNGTAIAFTPGTDIANISVAIPIDAYPFGVHTLYIRTKSEKGVWSVASIRDFMISVDPVYPQASASVADLVRAEYFINEDPGFGNAAAIGISPGTEIENILQMVDVSSYASGVHRFYLRTMDQKGTWGLTGYRDFVKEEDFPYPVLPPSPGDITFAEYFIDTDPGFGNGIPIGITPGLDLEEVQFVVTQTDTLSDGAHVLYIRSLDDWSITTFHPFTVGTELPLRLLSFTAAADGRNVLLNWSTTDEVNTAFFEIENSTDGVRFEKLAVRPSENRPGVWHYGFSHESAPNGLLYYRLKQVDHDGSYVYSRIRSVDLRRGARPVIAPNPVISGLTVKHVNTDEIDRIQVIGTNGVVLSSFSGMPELDRYVRSLKTGLYILRLTKKDGGVQALSFVKN